MEISVETIKTSSLTLKDRESEILIILGNSRVIAEIVFNSHIAIVLESYGLTQQELYSFLLDLPSISEFNDKYGEEIITMRNN